MAIFTTLSAAGIFETMPPKGDQLMLSLWGILVSAPTAACPAGLHCCLLASVPLPLLCVEASHARACIYPCPHRLTAIHAC
jgi:hypothetical protein